ncbi:hypothetical protein SDC9_15089 [bioreactor metagenome]|uniref:GGDEF domain-containing protein n=1 Tax=bioreactor metagenome TaxID=1076179 RepID=A0A644TR60_9ZZZZ|nr:GGDEF domain-containing protein [Negativicutes bacterium]
MNRFYTKFIIFTIVLLILSSVIQMIGAERVVSRAVEAVVLDANKKAAFYRAEYIQRHISEITNELRVIARDKSIHSDMNMLSVVNQIIPDVNSIFVFDRNGIMTATTGTGLQWIGDDYSERDYFKQAIQGKEYVSDMFLSRANRQVITIAVPIYEEGGSASGVVAGSVWLKEGNPFGLFDSKTSMRKGQSGIVDAHGKVIYHTIDSRIGGDSGLASEIKELSAKQEEVITEKRLDGEGYYTALASIPEIRWYVFFETPISEVDEINRQIHNQVAVIVALLSLVLIIVSIFVVRRFLRPLDTLTNAFKLLRQGKYTTIPIQTKDEFEEVIEAYNETVNELKDLHRRLESAADRDGLTGVYNRRAFNRMVEVLDLELNQGAVSEAALIFIDVDYFKEYNDSHGHLAGDDMLKAITGMMVAVAGERSVFRFGGDEFVIMLRAVKTAQAIELAREITSHNAGGEYKCTLSIGIATVPEDGATVAEVVDKADKALYTSKMVRNRITVYAEENS